MNVTKAWGDIHDIGAIDLQPMQSFADWRRLGFSATDMLALSQAQQRIIVQLRKELTASTPTRRGAK